MSRQDLPTFIPDLVHFQGFADRASPEAEPEPENYGDQPTGKHAYPVREAQRWTFDFLDKRRKTMDT